MFCDSNDTIITPRGRACFENTQAKQSTYFGKKSGFSHVCRINVPVFKVLNVPPGMFRDSNDTTLTSCGFACFENTHAKRSTYFGQKQDFPMCAG